MKVLSIEKMKNLKEKVTTNIKEENSVKMMMKKYEKSIGIVEKVRITGGPQKQTCYSKLRTLPLKFKKNLPPEFPSSEMKQPVNLSRRQIDGSGSAWKVPKETPEDQMIALGAKDDFKRRKSQI